MYWVSGAEMSHALGAELPWQQTLQQALMERLLEHWEKQPFLLPATSLLG
jgi:hypothetical protein